MAATRPARKGSRRPSKGSKVSRGRTAKAGRRAGRARALPAVRGAARRDIGAVRLEVGPAGAARVKRVVYPAGFRWSVDMKALVGTDLCMHAHVGFLASGAIRIEYPDGCAVEYAAPAVVAIDPGHDGAVLGEEPAVLIEVDFERDTVERLGMAPSHRHA